MSSENVIVNVRILDKDYQVNCRAGEREELIASAQYLHERMQEIREHGKVIGPDRVAVMAALNITHDLLKCRANPRAEQPEDLTAQRLRQLQSKIEIALNKTRQMEL